MAANPRKNTEHEELRDHNRGIKLDATRLLQSLIALAEEPTFTGRITVSVHSVRGRLKPPAELREQFHG